LGGGWGASSRRGEVRPLPAVRCVIVRSRDRPSCPVLEPDPCRDANGLAPPPRPRNAPTSGVPATRAPKLSLPPTRSFSFFSIGRVPNPSLSSSLSASGSDSSSSESRSMSAGCASDDCLGGGTYPVRGVGPGDLARDMSFGRDMLGAGDFARDMSTLGDLAWYVSALAWRK